MTAPWGSATGRCPRSERGETPELSEAAPSGRGERPPLTDGASAAVGAGGRPLFIYFFSASCGESAPPLAAPTAASRGEPASEGWFGVFFFIFSP